MAAAGKPEAYVTYDGIVCVDGQPVARVPVKSGSDCWGVWWAFLACVAGILLAVFWQRIKAGIVAGWAWVKARFRK